VGLAKNRLGLRDQHEDVIQSVLASYLVNHHAGLPNCENQARFGTCLQRSPCGTAQTQQATLP